ncbi:penicillin-binding transpeptidase domain-containing protein [Georgenia sp. H159]|uniref:penicillin-binding transpeptidase domain-containing protein n=1 Tax=Georgenia sp. H159 TaxID=3076115 RepID=UPI002D78F007|nr:penicillin-binding transpeptidase domain-containing protein [Georgenia sp. H159]
MTRHRRAAVPTALVLLATSGVVACSSDPGPEIDRTAEQLAATLESGGTENLWTNADLSVPLTNLAGLPRQVSVVEVGEPRMIAADGPRAADVSLRWDWDLDEDGTEDWTYTTEARITEDSDGNWAAAYEETVLAPGLGDGATLRLSRPAAGRGEVLGGDGTAVVTDRPVRRVGVDKTRFPDGATDEEIHAAAIAVAEAIGFDDPVAYAERVMAAGPRAFVEAITVREGSEDVAVAELDDVPGAVALPDELPLAPTTTWARPLLGRAGEATAEIIEESDGEIGPGDVVGLSGLQRTYDAHLRGTPGLAVTLDYGGDSHVVFEEPPVDGEDLQLSLDAAVQTAAEQALEGVEAPAGLLALRPSTGEVLAVANSAGTEGQNIAMLATLAPGSSFKVVTALALLRAGVGPDDVVSCTPEATVSGYSIANYPDYPPSYLGDITMTDAIAQSCNSALIHARDRLTPQDLADAAASLGIGQPLRVDWGGFTGSVPTEMTDTELAASLIGQGDVLASPLAMATVAASVRAGEVVTPRLVLAPDELADAPHAAADDPPHPLTPEEADVLTRYMRAVVDEGTGVLLSDVPGEPVHAKTGSAEVGEGDSYRVDSWMIAHRGDLAVAALVHGGGHGAGAAGDAVERFLRNVSR